MSLFLSGGVVDCGPSNALKDLTSKLELDHGVQRPRRVILSSPAGQSSISPPQLSPFDLSSLRAHLAPTPPPQFLPLPHAPLHQLQNRPPAQFADEGWADGFSVADKGKGKARADSSWITEFEAQRLQHRQQHQSQHQPQRWNATPSLSAGMGYGRPFHSMQIPLAPWQAPQMFQTPSFPQMENPHLSHPTTQDPHQHSFHPEEIRLSQPPTQFTSQVEQQTDVTSERNQASDVLARTAQSLLNGLASESSILNDNPQLAKSQFMNLVRSVADGSVVVDDPTGTVASSSSKNADYVVEEGARFVHKSGGGWAADFLGQGSTNSVLEATTTFTADRMQEQDALTLADGPRRTKSVHFDDIKEIYSDVPDSIEEAMKLRTTIPGAGTAWEDAGMDNEDIFDTDSFMAFNGQARVDDSLATREVTASGREAWLQLQHDWDEHQRLSRGDIKPAVDHSKYLFQRQNPYTEGETIIREDSPTVMGVLELEGAVQQNPTDASSWVALGLKQQENERENAAILALSKATQLDPENEQAYLALAVSYTNEGERESANTALERWIELRERRMGLDGSEKAVSDINESERRGKEMDVGVGSVGSSMEMRAGSGTWIKGQRKLIERLIEMARKNPEEVDADVQVALGVLFNATEEYEKAQDCFLAALSVRPDDWLLYNRLGATLANSGQSAAAIDYYLRALELHPSFVRALFNLGIAYSNLGQYNHAAQRILDALRLQHADATEGYASSASIPVRAGMGQFGSGGPSIKGVTSDALWTTLRSACLHMNRPDWMLLASKKDLHGFPLTLDM